MANKNVAQASLLESPQTFLLNPFDSTKPLNITERNLPHWEQEGTTYFITFRLADSLPVETVNLIKKEKEIWLQSHHEPYSEKEWIEYNKLFSQRIHDLLDAGSGSCILKDKSISDLVKKTLLFFNDKRYKLGRWIIMPNHIHVMVTPINDFPIEKICHSWKSFSANEINKKLNSKGQIWQHESYDHIIRNLDQLAFYESYIQQNPKKAKLTFGFQLSD